MTGPILYARNNAARFEDELKAFLRIPSVSTLPERGPDVKRAANWLADRLRQAGLTTVEILPTAGHPVVWGEWMGAGKEAPTVLFYGHYDVQPASLEEGWNSDPFEPIVRDGRLVARGASDDKGPTLAHIQAVESIFQTEGRLPVNIRFLIEGEEETGSPNLGAFVAAQRDRLRADVCLISDTAMKSIDQPSICFSTRGLMYLEMAISGPSHDLHSGGFGGIVHNPAQALAEILAQLHGPDGSVQVPGFYDAVQLPTPAERQALQPIAPSEAEWLAATGVPQLWGEQAFTPYERIGLRPTLEINGMVSGFTGTGSKTVLPARAAAKLSCRLVPNQDPQRIFELLRDQLFRLTPPTVRAEVRLLAAADPVVVDTRHPVMEAAALAYERGWGKRPVFERGGGTLPILADFQRYLDQLPIVMMGFGLVSDGAHGPDESFSLDMYQRGIQTAIAFYDEVARLPAG